MTRTREESSKAPRVREIWQQHPRLSDENALSVFVRSAK